MSSYERYDRTATHYDDTRWPAGHEIVTGCIAQAPRPLAEVRLLDAGCGTGNYARALVDRVGRLTGLDLEPAMLARARVKLDAAIATGRAELLQGSVLDLPFADAAFDAVMVNQMLHHLPGTADDPFAGWRRAIGECARVLRPGGVLAINSCAAHQLERGYWYYALIPEAAARVRARFAPLGLLREMLEDVGLRPRGSFVPVDAVLMREAYFDPRVPLDPRWRAGDSSWALVTAEELERALARLRRLDAEGRLEAFLREQDAARPEIGQITILYALRE